MAIVGTRSARDRGEPTGFLGIDVEQAAELIEVLAACGFPRCDDRAMKYKCLTDRRRSRSAGPMTEKAEKPQASREWSRRLSELLQVLRGSFAVRMWRSFLVLSVPIAGWSLWFHPGSVGHGSPLNWKGLFPAAVLAVPAWLLCLLWRIPKWQVTAAEKRGTIEPRDAADLEDTFRKTFAQVIAGIGAAGALYFTYQANEAAKDKQLTDQYAKAVEQLGTGVPGDDKLAIRLGGIYSLARIANVSEKDRWPSLQVLAAYVREYDAIMERKGEETKKEEALPEIGRAHV